jgi:hypothetical protein
VSIWFEFINTSWCDVPHGAIQRLWRDVVQQLQRWLRMPRRLELISPSGSDLCSWKVLSVGRDVVYEL